MDACPATAAWMPAFANTPLVVTTPPQSMEEMITEKRHREPGAEPLWIRSSSLLMNHLRSADWSLADGSGAEIPIDPQHGCRRGLLGVMQDAGDRL